MAIIEVPTSGEFQLAAFNALNLAWSITTELAVELERAEVAEWDNDGEVTDEYWRKAQVPLSNALTLTQQGLELMLKSRIASVTPFLLLTKDVRDWPSADKKDVPFAEFRSVDAADLVKLHNSVHSDKMDAELTQLFDNVRRRRNQIMHQGKDRTATSLAEMLQTILVMVRFLAPTVSWMKQRADYLGSGHSAVAFSDDFATDQIVAEAAIVINSLGAGSLMEIFKFDKKARRYFCPECLSNVEGDASATAHLRPNKPESATLYCLACDDEHDVKRVNCEARNCKSNVMSEDGVCLICCR